jgi:hypothetical protein
MLHGMGTGHTHDDHGHGHDHPHEHEHDHGHGHHHGHHHHAPKDFSTAFALGITLNLAFVVIEAWYGWRADSLALLADAGHNLGDVAGLVLAWAGALAGRLQPDGRHTYGWKRASLLAAFLNAAAARRDGLAGLGGGAAPRPPGAGAGRHGDGGGGDRHRRQRCHRAAVPAGQRP